MWYPNVKKGIFQSRPNRFIAQVFLEGRTEICHVKNTGRCRELLIPGTEVWVSESANPARKTKYDLISVRKGTEVINLDSQAPNRAAAEWLQKGELFPGITLLKPESVYGNSRFDFYLEAGECRAFLEVKGVTLEEDGVARFPDAPTERGVRHIKELVRCRQEGYEACLLFVIQMKGVHCLMPNDRTHPAFGEALRDAAEQGVRIFARDCLVTPDSMTIDQPVKVEL
ncbi:MAG: DNA/RNA nuclease SfsA [Candidatus Limivivens sp.]|nr:DNA/RNA nuclease SfsA [Candidatus Limivivens sp.]